MGMGWGREMMLNDTAHKSTDICHVACLELRNENKMNE